jgi:hypothetical protein
MFKINDLVRLNPDYYYAGNYSEDYYLKSPLTFIYEQNFQILPVIKIVSMDFFIYQRAVLLNNVFCLFYKKETLREIKHTLDGIIQIYKNRNLKKTVIIPLDIFSNKIFDREIINYLQDHKHLFKFIILKRGYPIL